MHVRWPLALAMAALLAGCASFSQTVSGWFGAGPETSETPAAQSGETFYAAVDGLAVRAEPSASAAVVGRLTLHQRVTRTGLERGYANITAAPGGLSGWVDNAQLLWRLPAAPAAAPAAGASAPRAVPSAPPVDTPAAAPRAAAPADVEPPPTAIELPAAQPTAPAAAVAPASTATPTAQPRRPGAEPAIFDPF